jgi:hypothetical protein
MGGVVVHHFRTGIVFRASFVAALALLGSHLSSAPAQAAVTVVERDDFSLQLGLRLQPRMEVERFTSTTNRDWIRDFLIRRTRLKANGKMLRAAYNFEWRIDRTDALLLAPLPPAAVENAWIQYPLGRGVEIRAGLYDLPYSRDRLTSDSRQLAVDRGAVSNVLDAVGMADNAVGFDFRGRVRGGRAQYAVGMFDNRLITASRQDLPMVTGRLDFNFGSTADVFQDCHFGTDSWYSLGLNGSWHGELENDLGGDDDWNAAAGVDGMVDVPLGGARVFGRGEINRLRFAPAAGGNSLDTTVWSAGGGLLINQRFQPIVRYDQVLRDEAEGGGSINVTYVGANYYQNQHSLKLQADVRLQSGTGEPVDGARLQAQLDF